MKLIEIQPAPVKNQSTIYDMPVGSVGRRLRDDRHFYRTIHTAVCLDAVTQTIDDIDEGTVDPVELLPKGTRLLLETTVGP